MKNRAVTSPVATIGAGPWEAQDFPPTATRHIPHIQVPAAPHPGKRVAPTPSWLAYSSWILMGCWGSESREGLT